MKTTAARHSAPATTRDTMRDNGRTSLVKLYLTRGILAVAWAVGLAGLEDTPGFGSAV